VAGLIPFYRKPPGASPLAHLPLKEKFQRLDPLGSVALIVGLVCLVLAVELGGSKYPWSNGRIIALFVIFAVAFSCWVGWQIHLGPLATIPPSVISQRSMRFVCFYAFCQGASNLGVLYFAPIWLEGVKGDTAEQSGLSIIPYVAGMTFTMLATGYFLTKGGYSAPFMLLCIVVTTIALGLFQLWTPESRDGKILGYLVMYGLGMGFGWQQPTLIAQTMLQKKDIPTGTSLATVCKLLGGTIFISVGESLFNNKLKSLIRQRLPGLDADSLVHMGATQLRSKLPEGDISEVLLCYNDALRPAWWMLLGLGVASTLGAVGVEWRNVKNRVATSAPAAPTKEQPMLESQAQTLQSGSLPNPSDASSQTGDSRETAINPLDVGTGPDLTEPKDLFTDSEPVMQHASLRSSLDPKPSLADLAIDTGPGLSEAYLQTSDLNLPGIVQEAPMIDHRGPAPSAC
jgi:hypothetical protein